MANVSPKLTVPYTIGTGLLVGQGNNPELVALTSVDDASVTVPAWVDKTVKVRHFSVSRGAASELEEVPAGTGSVTLDNHDRAFDPSQQTVPILKPFNRWWLMENFSGETQSLIKGYAELYDNQWPEFGIDATCTVNLVDEFKVLALATMPTTDPPRDTYSDVVLYDNPVGYWDLNDNAGVGVAFDGSLKANVGTNTLHDQGSGGRITRFGGLIQGDQHGSSYGVVAPIGIGGSPWLQSDPMVSGEPGDFTGLVKFTIEFWMMTTAFLPSGSGMNMLQGPPCVHGSGIQWVVSWAAGFPGIVGSVNNSAGTLISTGIGLVPYLNNAPTSGPFHIAMVLDGTNLLGYINGVQTSSSPWTGTVDTMNTGVSCLLKAFWQGGTVMNAGENVDIDEIAFYNYNLSASRILAHYQAGQLRGFPASERPTARAVHVLDSVASRAPRSLPVATTARPMASTYLHGQAPLEEMQKVRQAELPDGKFFSGRDGTLTLLDFTHRAPSPNAAANGNFEGGTAVPWAGVGGGSIIVVQSNENIHSGTFAGRITTAALGDGASYAVSGLTVGATYTVQCWMWVGLSATARCNLESPTGTGLGSTTTLTGNNGWQMTYGTFVAGAGGTATIKAVTVSGPAAQNVWVDDLVIGPGVSAFFQPACIFGDAGSELQYIDISLDYSDSFLANAYTGASTNGLLQSAQDNVSIGRYFKRLTTITDLPLRDDTDVLAIIQALLVKYKDPLYRITQIAPNLGHADTALNSFRRDLGDRIEIRRTTPAGGSRLVQNSFIQQITVSGTPTPPWSMTFVVSPV